MNSKSMGVADLESALLFSLSEGPVALSPLHHQFDARLFSIFSYKRLMPLPVCSCGE